MDAEIAFKAVRAREAAVVVLGLGHVGLPTALCLAEMRATFFCKNEPGRK
jgi:UDP-N-acetyl-D-mannosaminuronate dehydrogenase